MPLLSIDDLITPITPDQALETFLSELEAFGIPARSWRKAGAYRTILRVLATAYAGYSQVQVAAIKSGFLDTAAGGWLTLLAQYVFNVTRINATFATGAITLVNTSGGLYTQAAGTYVVKSAASGKQYVNTAPFTLNPASTLTGVPVQALEIGSASNAVADGAGNPTIDTQVTVLNGVTVSNPAAVIGTDAETDDALRVRCLNKLASLSPNGPRGAYEYAVATATHTDGSPVNVNRAVVSPESTHGTVTVWIASPSGSPSPADITAVEANIEAIARPDSVTVFVFGATPHALSTPLTVWAKTTAGLDAPTLTTLVAQALNTMASGYPIGGIIKPPSTQGYLYAGTIEEAAASAHPAIFDVDGASDLLLNPGEVPVITAAVTVRFVNVPPGFT